MCRQGYVFMTNGKQHRAVPIYLTEVSDSETFKKDHKDDFTAFVQDKLCVAVDVDNGADLSGRRPAIYPKRLAG